MEINNYHIRFPGVFDRERNLIEIVYYIVRIVYTIILIVTILLVLGGVAA